VRKTITVFFLAGILMSFRLWTADRVFPLLPVSDVFLFVRYPFDYILAFLLIGGLCLGFFFEKKSITWITLAILMLLLLQDQNRLQAWVYLYALFLALFALLQKNNRETILLCARIIIIGIYIWTGIHKFNPAFIDVTWNSILHEFLKIRNESFPVNPMPFGYIVPLVEITSGLMLCFPKTRNAGVWMIITTHLFILVYLSPLGINTNSVVYPWNIAMMALVFVLFYRTKDKLEFFQKSSAGVYATMIVAWLLPLLNFFGLWDHYLSFSYYSSKQSMYYVAVADEELNKLDPSLKSYFIPSKRLTGGVVIDVNKWSLGELNVPFYPEKRTFKILARSFCNYGIDEESIYFLQLPPPFKKGTYIKYTCKDFN
jgi:hypothetical protein